MKHKIKKLKDSQVEIKIELSPEEFNEFKEKAISELKKDFQTKGFRKGKAPNEVVQKKIGQGNILEEAAQLAIEQSYFKCVLSEKIRPIADPQVKILKFVPGNPFVFSVNVQVVPEIRLPDYIAIAKGVKRKRILVGEDEVDNVLKQLQLSRAKLTVKNDIAKKGDFIQIEYSCPQIEKGKKFQDGFILGKGFFVSGFEDNLISTKANQEKEFSLKIPKGYFQKDLADKELTFNVVIKSVQNVELPEINDDFAKNLGTFEDLSALKKSVKEGLKAEKEILENKKRRKEILDKIREASEIVVPEVLIEREKNYLVEEFNKSSSFSGAVKNSEEEVSKSFLDLAEKRIKNSLIIKEISEKEELLATEEEIKEEVNRVLKQYSSFEKFKKDVDPNREQVFPEDSAVVNRQPVSNGVDLDLLRSYAKGAVVEEKFFQLLENVQKPNNSENN